MNMFARYNRRALLMLLGWALVVAVFMSAARHRFEVPGLLDALVMVGSGVLGAWLLPFKNERPVVDYCTLCTGVFKDVRGGPAWLALRLVERSDQKEPEAEHQFRLLNQQQVNQLIVTLEKFRDQAWPKD